MSSSAVYGQTFSYGRFVATPNTPQFIPLPQGFGKFEISNLSAYASPNSDEGVEFQYLANMPAGTAKSQAIDGATGDLYPWLLKQNGITYYNAANPPVYPVGAIASFVPGANTEFTTSAPHGLQVGDNVVITNLTTAPEMGGLVMTVTAIISTTQFETLFDSTGSVTSVGSFQKVGNVALPGKPFYYPQNRVIGSISSNGDGTTRIVTLVAQNYAVGDTVTFQMPSVFNIPQLQASTSGVPVLGTVTAFDNSVGQQWVDVNIDSSGFNAFKWPTSSAYAFSFPYMVPNNEGNLNNLPGVVPAPLPYANQAVLSFAQQNLGVNGVLIGAGDGTVDDVTGGIISADIVIGIF